jgi:hypothetical protein
LNQGVLLGFELFLGNEVLQGTPATLSKMRTPRFNSVGRSLNYLNHFTFVIVSFPVRHTHQNPFAGQGSVNKYLFLCVSRDTAAIMAKIFDSCLEWFLR